MVAQRRGGPLVLDAVSGRLAADQVEEQDALTTKNTCIKTKLASYPGMAFCSLICMRVIKEYSMRTHMITD